MIYQANPDTSNENHDIKYTKKNNIFSLQTNKNILQRVPLNIFQTWHTLELPPHMKRNVDILKQNNPEFKHYLYDDEMCKEFIRTHFDSDTLYAFQKLKPGAYKADLWRYCVLYIHGGIYLDIKFECVNKFPLIKLTDKEYWVRDTNIQNIIGIYQALMVCYPRTQILRKIIDKVIYNVKNNQYTTTCLCVTGPHLLNNFFFDSHILNFELQNINGTILLNNSKILTGYNGYRKEQQTLQKTLHYSKIWNTRNIYNYPTLNAIKIKNITRTIERDGVTYFSSTPFIIESNNTYMIILKWINYAYHEDGYKNVNKYFNTWKSFNSFFTYDKDLSIKSEEIFSETMMEDIRLFQYKNQLLYTSSCFNNFTKKNGCSCGEVYEISTFFNEKNVIQKNFDIYRDEKNWVYCELRNELKIIYNWYPLTIAEVDFENNELLNCEFKYNLPEIFKQAKGGTCGVIIDNQIWFVLHVSQNYNYNKNHYSNYQHFFAIFDLDMNLTRHSELFKFDDKKIEFCTSLIIDNKQLIMGFSTLDTNSYIGIYDKIEIETTLKWEYN
jgi:hypothetical protein